MILGKTCRPVRAAAFAFVVTLAVAAWSLLWHRQLGDLRGPGDLWLVIAFDSSKLGDLARAGEPTMFKPPGYPALVRSVLWITRHLPSKAVDALAVPSEGDLTLHALGLDLDREAFFQRLAGPVYWANALVLAGATALMCVWLARFLPLMLALAGALTFGVNPYVLAYVGIPHYAIVFMALLVASCWATERALAAGPDQKLPLVTAGLLWGLTTLVRPVTLILPPFLWLAFLWRHKRNLRGATAQTALLVGTMILAVLPWTARNYVLSGRLVPVSAQAWLNVWAATFQPSEPKPNHYRWKEIRRPLAKMLKQVPGNPLRGDPYAVGDNLWVEDAARARVLNRLQRRRSIYVDNAWGSFTSYHLHVNSILIGLYAHLKQPGARLITWYGPGSSQERYASKVADGFVYLTAALSLLALGGLLWSFGSAGPPLLGTAAAHFCLAVAHSITWMDLMYYCTKWPFLVVFAFAFLHWALRAHTISIGRRTVDTSTVVGWALATVPLALTLALLLP